MAHMSGGEGLVRAFNHEGGRAPPDADPFRFLASRWRGVEVGKGVRRRQSRG